MRLLLHDVEFAPSLGGYTFESHPGQLSWVGRGSLRGDAADAWLALDPWGRCRRGLASRDAAAEWCARQQPPHGRKPPPSVPAVAGRPDATSALVDALMGRLLASEQEA